MISVSKLSVSSSDDDDSTSIWSSSPPRNSESAERDTTERGDDDNLTPFIIRLDVVDAAADDVNNDGVVAKVPPPLRAVEEVTVDNTRDDG